MVSSDENSEARYSNFRECTKSLRDGTNRTEQTTKVHPPIHGVRCILPVCPGFLLLEVSRVLRWCQTQPQPQ